MNNDPHTHLLLDRLTTAEGLARRPHRPDRRTNERGLAYRLWITLRHRRRAGRATPMPVAPTAVAARPVAPTPVAAAAADAVAAPCADDAPPAPRAA